MTDHEIPPPPPPPLRKLDDRMQISALCRSVPESTSTIIVYTKLIKEVYICMYNTIPTGNTRTALVIMMTNVSGILLAQYASSDAIVKYITVGLSKSDFLFFFSPLIVTLLLSAETSHDVCHDYSQFFFILWYRWWIYVIYLPVYFRLASLVSHCMSTAEIILRCMKIWIAA